ncbi:MAG: ABC transporter permease [Pseudomonadota bacterium]|nr:ABC transporter permease [Pseudomonadota bacterium]MED5472630.1 ABC transporter permease [Pseudomonadota bacterium]
MFSLERRVEQSKLWLALSPLLAIVLTILSGIIIFSVLDKDPWLSLYTFFIQPLTTGFGFTELIVKATPLILIGAGLSIGFKANVWNIGAEGQFTMGAIAGGGTALFLSNQESLLVLPAVIVMGIIGGAVWGMIPAFLKTKYNANEILTSLMLSYVALLMLSYLVHGPWRDPGGYNFPESEIFSDSAMLPVLLQGTRLNLGTIFALLSVLITYLLLSRTVLGYQFKVAGLAPLAARYAGFNRSKLIWLSMIISGGLAGLAGIAEVSGTIGQLLPSVSPGYGFTAIIVAFLGRLNPIGVLFAGLILALTYIGGENAQIEIGLPAAVTGLFQGIILFYLLACDVLARYRLRYKPFLKVSSRE